MNRELERKPPPIPASPPLLARPTWTLVLMLALPVLAQQALAWFVGQTDRFLAGQISVLTPDQQVTCVGLHLEAGMHIVNGSILQAQVAWELANQIQAKQAAFQAAQTTAHYLAWFIYSSAILVTVGSTALVARFIGAGDRPLASAVTHQSLLLAVFLGGVGTLFGLGGGITWIVELAQLRSETATFAADYLRPIFVLLIFQMIESAGIACLVGAGDTRTGLYVMIGVALINIPLAWSFCLGLGPFPELGFVGIAMGTACSHLLGAIVVLAVLARGRFGLRLHLRLFQPRFDLLYRLLRVSVPAGFDTFSLIVGQFWFLSIINTIGEVASAAQGIAIGWEGLGFQSGVAFGTAAMTLVGQNLGAGRPHDAERAGWMAFTWGCASMSLMGLIFFTLAGPMFRLFCPNPEQLPIIVLGVPVLRLIAFAMPSLASTIIFTYALRGAGDTRVPVLFTTFGFFVVRIPLAYFFIRSTVDLGTLGSIPGLDLGLFGGWLAMSADLFVRGVFFFFRFARGAWKMQKV